MKASRALVLEALDALRTIELADLMAALANLHGRASVQAASGPTGRSG